MDIIGVPLSVKEFFTLLNSMQDRVANGEDVNKVLAEEAIKNISLPLTCLRCGGPRKEHQGYCDKCFYSKYK